MQQLPTVPRSMTGIIYQGRRMPVYHAGREVRTDAKVFVSRAGHVAPLQLQHDIYKRAVTHEWGYVGAGPAQLAFDILMDFFGDAAFAWRYTSEFDDLLGRRLSQWEEWELAGPELLGMIEAINQAKGWGPLDPDSDEYRRLQVKRIL